MNFNPVLAICVSLASCLSLATAAETEMTFAAKEGFELRGTLALPDGAGGPVPGVLLLSGSGPTDRNGDQGPMRTGLQKQLAAALAEAGIASFRFDKRAVPVYAEHFPPLEAMGPFFAFERFVDDAARALAALREREEIDGDRVAAAGHSEGALIALTLAAGERPPDAVACLAGPGRPIAVLMREQIGAQFEQAAPDQKAAGLAAVERAIEAAKAGEPFPADLPAWTRTLFNPSTSVLTKDYAETDPAEVMARTECPIFILNGAMDAQVSAERDAETLAAAARARGAGPVELVIVPNASHNLKRVSATTDPGFSGDVVDEALNPFVAWCVEQLGAGADKNP